VPSSRLIHKLWSLLYLRNNYYTLKVIITLRKWLLRFEVPIIIFFCLIFIHNKFNNLCLNTYSYLKA
jgi:hypothetical protein